MDIVEKHRRKVLMIRKGKNWHEEVSSTKWLMAEIGGGEETLVEVEQTKDRQVFKVWCEGREARRKILERKKKWEEEGVAEVEEWLSIAERRAGAKAIAGMKRMAKEAGYRNARIEVREKVWNEEEEDGKGKGTGRKQRSKAVIQSDAQRSG